MEMHQVRYFLAVCEAQNFSRAAEACNVAQPSLTKAIKKLEGEFGGELFYRERHRTNLTDLGRKLKPHFETVYAATAAAKADADGFRTEEAMAIDLGVMSTIGPSLMIDFFSRLRRENPSLDINIREAKGHDLVRALRDGEIDVGLIGLPDLPDDFRTLPLYSERYTIAFAKGHSFERMNAVSIAELDGIDYLNRVHCEFVDHFEALGFQSDFKVNVRYTSEREDWIQALVVAEMGCAIMPEHLPILPGVSTRPITEPEVSRTISLVTVAGRRHSHALTRMIRLAGLFPWPGKAPDW
ncbi:MAG: LysR family transcriptional regulator [Geminicoccaceae bacterium]